MSLDQEGESITSHIFRLITVVPFLRQEVARALFSCVLSGNPNLFLSQIPLALLSLGFCQMLISELPVFQVKVRREKNSRAFQWTLIFSEAGHCQII